MCDLCDDPDLTPEAYLKDLRRRLDEHPIVVQSVFGSPTTAEFSYTIGLTAHGLPELIVLGRRHEEAATLLLLWGQYLLEESVVLPGETLGSGPFVMEAVEVEHPERFLLMADSLFGPAVRALQLVWADDRGRWPWDPGHRARRSGQPVLGTRAPAHCRAHDPNRLEVPPYLE